LLASIGASVHQLIHPNIDETPRPAELPADYVLRMAVEKARAGWQRVPTAERANAALLAADTSVVLEQEILGKPESPADARAMLEALSGREHRVLSAVTVITQQGDGEALEESAVSESKVLLASLSAAEIDAYVATAEPMDKAGSYAVQGFAAIFIEHLSGSYSGVMGLPLAQTGHLLRQARVQLWGGKMSALDDV
jgi:septum formation protein